MKDKSRHFNRRDLLKIGITAAGIAAIPEGIITAAENNNKKPVVRKDKEQQKLFETAEKYGAEFGGIKPDERRG